MRKKKKTRLENLVRMRDVCKMHTNLKIFWIKFVPLEMKMFVNIENSLWIVETPYPWYINDSNSHFQCFFLSKLAFLKTLKIR